MIWEIEVDILSQIHNVCMKQGLRYSLAYGTLLGAVRHKGFIPWDDDIDIIMPREDYDQLIGLWPKLPIASEYILQNKYTDPDYTQNFSKIRKNHTTFVQVEEELKVRYHTGIFVDIFPGDRVATGVREKLQFAACALNLLYARNFASGSTGVIGLIEKVLLLMPEKVRQALYKITDQYIQRWKNEKSQPLFFPSTIQEVRKHYPADLFDEMTDLEFCGKHFMCIKKYKDMLTYDYGDYMKLPPIEQQVMTHHPLIIDFGHNRDEI